MYAFPSLDYLGDIGNSSAPQSTRFSECGKYIAVHTLVDNEAAVAVWDLQLRRPKGPKILRRVRIEIEPELDWIIDIRFSKDGTQVLALDAATNLYTWDWRQSDRPSAYWQLRHQAYSAAFLSDTTFISFPVGRPGEVHALASNRLEKSRQLDSLTWRAGRSFRTPDGKYTSYFNDKDRFVYVHSLEKQSAPVIDKMLDHWLPPKAGKDGEQGERHYVLNAGVTGDLSLIMLYYEIRSGSDTLKQGFGFFPRTSDKAREFDIDLKKHTHLFLAAPEKSRHPGIVLSPDGRWLAFTDVDLPPRIWEISTLGKALLAEKSIIKK